MKKIEEFELSKIKGGSLLGDISKIGTCLFDGITELFTGVSNKVEMGIFSSKALDGHYDKMEINLKNDSLTIDNTKNNQNEYDLKMQELKEFGTPTNQPELMIF